MTSSRPTLHNISRTNFWTRFLSANGSRFHVADDGSGPLVLLLHGFPQFWWAWRHQLLALTLAGFRACALDLRGYGDSDKPLLGYDPFTLAADVAGVSQRLTTDEVTVVCHKAHEPVLTSLVAVEPAAAASETWSAVSA